MARIAIGRQIIDWQKYFQCSARMFTVMFRKEEGKTVQIFKRDRPKSYSPAGHTKPAGRVFVVMPNLHAF